MGEGQQPGEVRWPSGMMIAENSTNQNIVKSSDNHKGFFDVCEHFLTVSRKPFIYLGLKDDAQLISKRLPQVSLVEALANHYFDFG